ncbi:MAG: hypothetical protein AAGF11_26965 [Myxococcota bacterium]
MNDNHTIPETWAQEALSLDDLIPEIATCGGLDPGPDPTWDPDEFPDDDKIYSPALPLDGFA